MFKFIKTEGIDYIYTTIFTSFPEPLDYAFSYKQLPFTDKMKEILRDMLRIYGKYSRQSFEFTANDSTIKVNVLILGNVTIFRLRSNSNNIDTNEDFTVKYDEFRSMLKKFA